MRPVHIVLVVSMILGAVACGEDASESTSSTTEPSVSTTTIPDQPTTTVPVQPTTTDVTSTTTPEPSTTTSSTLPGEVIDFGPREGDLLMVIGVPYDDELNLRSGPSVFYDVIATMAPDYSGIVALGETRHNGAAFWIAADVEGTSGWVHLSYVGYEGLTDDLTSQVVADLGEYPTAPTMTELGLIVAESMASEDPASKIVVVVSETVGDLGEVTYDVIGLGDDAVLGLRVHVFGEPTTGGFSLKSAEVTTICGRGVTPDGLCP